METKRTSTPEPGIYQLFAARYANGSFGEFNPLGEPQRRSHKPVAEDLKRFFQSDFPVQVEDDGNGTYTAGCWRYEYRKVGRA